MAGLSVMPCSLCYLPEPHDSCGWSSVSVFLAQEGTLVWGGSVEVYGIQRTLFFPNELIYGLKLIYHPLSPAGPLQY